VATRGREKKTKREDGIIWAPHPKTLKAKKQATISLEKKKKGAY